jgi:hypothetical protein
MLCPWMFPLEITWKICGDSIVLTAAPISTGLLWVFETTVHREVFKKDEVNLKC